MARRARAGAVVVAVVALSAPLMARADDSRIPTTLVAQRAVQYVSAPQVYPSLQGSSVCVGFPYSWFCTPAVPVPWVGVSGGFEGASALVRLTTAAGAPLGGRVVRIVGRVTGTSCDVVTDADGIALAECAGSVTSTPAGIGVVTDLSWSVDEQGFDASFAGDAAHAPATASAGPAGAELRP